MNIFSIEDPKVYTTTPHQDPPQPTPPAHQDPSHQDPPTRASISRVLTALTLATMLVVPNVTMAQDDGTIASLRGHIALLGQRMKGLAQVRKDIKNERKELKKNLREVPGKNTHDDDEDNGKKPARLPCILVASNQIVSSAFMTAHPQHSIVLACESMPKGIAQRLLGHALPDTKAPILSAIATFSTNSTTRVSWKTNEKATGTVFYSTVSPLDPAATTTKSVTHASLTKHHNIELTGLNASTTYYVVVESRDAADNSMRSAQLSLVTKANPDVIAPTISVLASSVITANSAVISWATDESSTSKAFYSTNNPVDVTSTSTLALFDNTLVTSHSLNLTGLASATTYHFLVQSTDASGNKTRSAQSSLTTGPTPPDVTLPVISGISFSVSNNALTALWTTNEASTSKVYVGVTNPLDLAAATTLSVSNAANITAHSLNVTGLTASTSYFMVVESKDAAGNTARSAQIAFMTSP